MLISQLLIYSREGHYLSTITTNDYPFDATWTPRGSIVYTTYSKVVVGSKTGKVIAVHSQMTNPRYLSSWEDIIYLTDVRKGVFRSTDDGVSWNLVFIPHGLCKQAIKVTSDSDYQDDFWALVFIGHKYRLGVYCVDMRNSLDKVTWREINVTNTDSEHIQLHSTKLSFGGYNNIFLTDFGNKVVHVFSVTGQYHGQLLPSLQLNNSPERLAEDKVNQLLYVGQGLGVVSVFKLSYGDGSTD